MCMHCISPFREMQFMHSPRCTALRQRSQPLVPGLAGTDENERHHKPRKALTDARDL